MGVSKTRNARIDNEKQIQAWFGCISEILPRETLAVKLPTSGNYTSVIILCSTIFLNARFMTKLKSERGKIDEGISQKYVKLASNQIYDALTIDINQ